MLVYILCNVTVLYLIVNCHGYVVFVVSLKYIHILNIFLISLAQPILLSVN